MENTISWYKDPGACFAAKIKAEMKSHKNVPIIFGSVDKDGVVHGLNGACINRINVNAVREAPN